MQTSKDIGAGKEREAVKALKKRGYKILETNFLIKGGEIDIIAKHKDTIVFVEVKYRKSNDFGFAQETVIFSKQKKIIKAALLYLQKNNIKDSNIRFDIAAINQDDIEIIENAFTAEGEYYI